MARPPITKAHPYTPRSGAFKDRTFRTEREYRNALASLKGFGSWHEQQRAAEKVTPTSFGTLRTSQKQARARALDALSKVRHGETLTRAAKEAGTTPNTVAKYAGENLHRERGRVVASKADRLFRVMNVITTEGVQEVPLRSSRQASLVAEHANAVKKFLLTGDDEPLHKFRGVKVAGHELDVRPEVLEELQRTGELEYEPYEK
jgi:hypothetical protein